MTEQKTLKRIDESAILPEKVLILNTLPLTANRFAAGKKRSLFSFLRYRNDFLQTQYPNDMGWDAYKSQVVYPILAELLAIKQHSAVVIDHDVRYKDFKKAVLSGRFNMIFLIAHHIGKTDRIEFANSAVPLSLINGFLEEKLAGKSLALNFIVCNGTRFTELKAKTQAYQGMISFGFWEFPVVESYIFIKHWMLQLDGKRNMHEAYVLAIREAFKQHLNSTQ